MAATGEGGGLCDVGGICAVAAAHAGGAPQVGRPHAARRHGCGVQRLEGLHCAAAPRCSDKPDIWPGGAMLLPICEATFAIR